MYVDPASQEVERDYVLDPHDPHVAVSVPPGFTESSANRSWLIFPRCGVARAVGDEWTVHPSSRARLAGA